MNLLDDLRLAMPHDLDPAAQRLWRHGDDTGGPDGRGVLAGDPPIPGDLWVASIGSDDFGPVDTALVLLTSVDEEGRFVSAVPVTVAAQTPGRPSAYLLAANPLGVPLVVHAALQTGLGFRALHRRIGDGLDALALARLVRAPFGEATAPLPVHATGGDDGAVDGYLAHLGNLMAALCRADTEYAEAS
ncbi:hypothetical protein [Nocardioides pakistanensis]